MFVLLKVIGLALLCLAVSATGFIYCERLLHRKKYLEQLSGFAGNCTDDMRCLNKNIFEIFAGHAKLELSFFKELNSENISDNNTVTEKIPMSSEQESTSPSEFLFQKMVQSRNKNTGDLTSDNEENQTKTKENITDLPNEEDLENPIEIDSQKSSDEEKNNAPKSEPLDIEAEINALKKIANLSVVSSSNTQEVKTTESENSKTPDLVEIPPEKEEKPEILNPLPSTQESVSPPSAKKENTSTSSNNNIKSVSSAEERRTTLLARCNAYLEDDEFGTAKIGTDKYKLESVESILKGFETRAAERVNKKFNNTYTPQTNI